MMGRDGTQLDRRPARWAERAGFAREAGHKPSPITTFGPPRAPDAIAKRAQAGVTRCIFGLTAAPAEDVLPRLDKIARLVETMRG